MVIKTADEYGEEDFLNGRTQCLFVLKADRDAWHRRWMHMYHDTVFNALLNNDIAALEIMTRHLREYAKDNHDAPDVIS